MRNIFDDIPTNIDDEVFTELACSNSVTIERIVSNGQASPESGWFDQEKNEWVIVLSGEAEIAFEDNNSVKLSAGNYLNIPAHQKHKVLRTSDEVQTVWLAIHYL